MADDVLSIQISADVSALQTQLNTAVASVEDFGSSASAAMDMYNEASKQGIEVQELLGEAFDKAQESGADFIASIQSANQAYQQYVQAAEEAAAATQAQAKAAELASTANRENAAAAMVANSALKVATGSIFGAERAAGTFLATTLDLGPVMSNLFPLIGAAAFAEVITDIGDKLGDLAFTAAEVGQSLQGGFWTGVNALMQGVGFDIDEVIKQETELNKINADLSQRNNELYASFLHLSEGPKAAGDYLSHEFDKIAVNYQERIRKQLAVVEQLQQTSGQTQVVVDKVQGITDQPTRAALQAKIDLPVEQGKLQALQQLDAEYQQKALDVRTKGEQEQARQDQEAGRRRSAAQKQADEEQLRGMEQTFNQMRSTRQLGLEDEIAFWEAMGDQVRKGSQAYETIGAKIGELWTRENEQASRATEDLQKKIAEFQDLTEKAVAPDEQSLLPQHEEGQDTFKYIEEQSTATANWARELQDALEIQVRSDDALAEAKLRGDEASGAIKGLAAQHAQATLHAKEQTEQLQLLEGELRRVQNAAYLTPAEQRAEEQGIQNKISIAQGQGAVVNAQDIASELAKVEEEYEKFFNVINRDFEHATNSWLEHQRTFSQSFIRSLGEMEISAATALEQMTLKWVEHEALITAAHLAGIQTRKGADAVSDSELVTELAQKLAKWAANELAIVGIHISSNAQKVTADTAAAATTQAATAAANVAQVTSYAAVAAAGAAAAVAAIPIVGPALAATAAASTFATTEAYASLAAFEAGGVVQGMSGMPVPIMAHAGERVLNTMQTQNFERMVNQTSSPSLTQHLHYEPKINAYDRTGMRSTLQSHADDILGIVRDGINTGRLSR